MLNNVLVALSKNVRDRTTLNHMNQSKHNLNTEFFFVIKQVYCLILELEVTSNWCKIEISDASIKISYSKSAMTLYEYFHNNFDDRILIKSFIDHNVDKYSVKFDYTSRDERPSKTFSDVKI